MSAVKKVLVYIRKTPSSIPVIGQFTDCVVDILSNDESNHAFVTCEVKDNKLILSPTNDRDTECKNSPPLLKGSLLTHPSFCPISHLPPTDIPAIPPEVLTRGIDVGVVTLLESSDSRVLLTRRAKHMRTFPGIWVPPGGHIEDGEGLLEAGLRELGEETGLKVNVSSWHVLCLWESVYPHTLSLGQPKRHHIVVYLHLRVDERSDVMDKRICLDKNEVDGSVWIDEHLVSAMERNGMDVMDGRLERNDSEMEERFVGMKILDTEGLTVDSRMPLSVFVATAPKLGKDIERLSTGTKYACIQWLNYCKNR